MTDVKIVWLYGVNNTNTRLKLLISDALYDYLISHSSEAIHTKLLYPLYLLTYLNVEIYNLLNATTLFALLTSFLWHL